LHTREQQRVLQPPHYLGEGIFSYCNKLDVLPDW
jgi:hypothetical protein